ncbi:MAG: PKD domain-containing protein [Bacteroidia bacterium]|nr:PKD domain-containing protein [Bacteroidia bacterium]
MKRWATLIATLTILLMGSTVRGQTANPKLLSDLTPGTASSSFSFFSKQNAPLNSLLYFAMYNNIYGSELYKTDGSTQTIRVTDLYPGPDGGVWNMIALGGELLITGQSDALPGHELWKSDGTAPGTVLVKDIFPGSEPSYPGDFVELNGIAYFHAANRTKTYNPPGNQHFTIYCHEIFRSDGTPGGTYLVKDFATSPYGSGIGYLTSTAGKLYFHVSKAKIPWGTQFNDLACSDGTANGSILLTSNTKEGEFVSPGDGRAFFKAHNSSVVFVNTRLSTGSELWITNGTALSTLQVKDINPGSTGSNPSWLVSMGSYVYFTANDGSNGVELWRSDGTAQGTMMIADICSGSASSTPQWLTPVNGTLFFTATDGIEGRQLWSYNPAAQPALARVMRINPGGDCEPLRYTSDPGWSGSTFNPNYPDGFFPVVYHENSFTFYFVANNGTHGFEMWQSDGSAQGTRMVKDVCTGCPATIIAWPTLALGKLFFWQNDGVHGIEPWVLDPSQPLDYIYNLPPLVTLSASTLQGTAPQLVTFTATASDADGSIVLYEWDFGDNSIAAGATMHTANHTYTSPGVYTAKVTVTDDGNASVTVKVTVTVASANAYAYVGNQTVSRVSKPGGKWAGRDVILVLDDTQLPVAGAAVGVSYSGPNSGTLNGNTGSNGQVILETAPVKNPSGTWCFTVTDVSVSGRTFNSSLGVISKCEAALKEAPAQPFHCVLEQNYPNPAVSLTYIDFELSAEADVRIRVFDLLGRELRSMLDSRLPEGRHTVAFDARLLPAGTYYYHLDAQGTRQTRVMVVGL